MTRSLIAKTTIVSFGVVLSFVGVVCADVAVGTGRLSSATGDFLNSLGVKQSVRVAQNDELSAFQWGGRVRRGGFAADGDGGGAEYIRSSAACAIPGGDGGSQIPASGGGCWNVDWTSVGSEATPEMFGGAVGFSVDGASGMPDAQPALQKALDTGRSVRLSAPFYRMGRCGTIKTPGQSIRGRGDNATALVFYPGFDTSNGACVLGLSQTVFAASRAAGPTFADFRIKGFQPEVSTGQSDRAQLASLMQVSCIEARGGYGAKFRDLTLTTCMRGIDLRGDVGQVTIDGLRGSNFYADVDLDGAQDSVRIRSHHNFPTNVTANQAGLALRNAVAIRSGRMDDLKVSDSMCIASHTCFYAYQGVAKTLDADGYISPGGFTSAQFVGYDFDTVSLGWQVDNGVVSFTGGNYASVAGGIINSGVVNVDAPASAGVSTATGADKFFRQNGGVLTIANIGAISDLNSDNTFVYQTAGRLTFTGNSYGWNPGLLTNITKPKIWSAGGTIIATGNLVMSKDSAGIQGNGAGFFRVDKDGPNVIQNNSVQSWRNMFPAAVRGIYGPNAGSVDVLTYPTYAQIKAAWTAGNAQGKFFTIGDASAVTYGGIAAGGGGTVARITSDGTNFRYY